MKIKIIETSWSGRPGYVPKEILHEYEAILNKEYVVKTRDVDYIKENKIIKSTEIVLSFVITSINAIIRIDEKAISYKQDEGFIEINILKHSEIVDLLILNMKELLKELQIQYDKYIKIQGGA